MENLERQREEMGRGTEGSNAATPMHVHMAEVPVGPGGVVPADFVMVGKLKTTVNEVLTCLGAPGNNYDIEDYIAVAEECLQALRILKVERRIEARRANNAMRAANSSIGGVAAGGYSPASPAANDDGDERPYTPAPISYRAALMKKRSSPKRSPFRAEMVTREDVEAARHAATLRSEERQRLAEERRMDRLQEMKLKSEAAEAREQRVKARREEAEMRQRAEAEDRLESSKRRAEEVRRQTVEKAQKTQARVDEVRLNNELRHQTKTMLLDKKMNDVEHNQEVQKEARQHRAQERNDAIEAAAERRRNMSEERAERQKEREQQRLEKLRRIEEQKKQEQEQKQQKAEEWEKKVHRHQKETSAETEAANKKAAEKAQQREQALEEQREKRRQKQERQEQKLKEAKARREAEAEAKTEAKPALQELMPPLTSQEEEQMSQRMTRLVAASARQGKAFSDNYQKESPGSTKDLNRSKLRPAFSRLTAAVGVPAPVQCKQPLNDLLSCELTETDHEFIRYFNQFDVLVKVIAEARKVRECGVVQQASDFLLLLFINEAEGKNNITYFVRSGGVVSLALCIREEMRGARQQGGNDVLRWMLSVVGVCVERLGSEPAQSKVATVRDQFLSDLDTLGLDRICLAIVKLNPRESDLELVYCALCVLGIELSVYSKRKNETKSSWFLNTVAACFTLLQNILTPGGVPITNDSAAASLSCGRVTLLFCVLRTLNMLARWQLVAFQALLHDSDKAGSKRLSTIRPPTGKSVEPNSKNAEDVASGAAGSQPVQITRQELFHVLSTFFLYIQDHAHELETIPAPQPSDADGPLDVARIETGSTSTFPAMDASTFDDAVRYGLTLENMPAFPPMDPASSNVNPKGGRDAYKPGGARYPLRAALHECILFIGYLCLDDHSLQDMLGWGEKKTLLGSMLDVLPAQYFSNAQHVLFPTVVAAVSDHDRNMKVVMAEMEPKLLHKFIQNEFQRLSKGAKAYATAHSRQLHQYKCETDPRYVMRQATTKARSWADMDDSDVLLEAHTTTRSTDTTSTTPAMEKEKLCKIFRAPPAPGLGMFQGFYKVDRRYPISYWPSVIEQLEQVLSSK